MKPFSIRVFVAVSIIAAGAAAFAVSTRGEEKSDFSIWWDNAISDLNKYKADIAEEELRAKGLEILRDRTIAKDDGIEEKR